MQHLVDVAREDGVGPIAAFWTEALAAWARAKEIEFRMRSGR